MERWVIWVGLAPTPRRVAVISENQETEEHSLDELQVFRKRFARAFVDTDLLPELNRVM